MRSATQHGHPFASERGETKRWLGSAVGTAAACLVMGWAVWRMGYAELYVSAGGSGLSPAASAVLAGVVVGLLLAVCGVHLLVASAWALAGWGRVGGLWVDFWVPATLGLAVLDSHIFATTGRHAVFYVDVAVRSDAGRWVGGAAWGQAAIAMPLAATLLAGCVVARLLLAGGRWTVGTVGTVRAWVGGGGVRRVSDAWLRSASAWGAWGALGVGVVWLGCVVVLLGGPWLGGSKEVAVLAEALPVDPWVGHRPLRGDAWEWQLEAAVQAELDRGFMESKGRSFEEVNRTAQMLPIQAISGPRWPGDLKAPTPRAMHWAETAPPDVVLLVLESWRADALSPDTMPRLNRLAGRGLRFNAHRSDANSSYLGLFALLHARPPLWHREAEASGVEPAMTRSFRTAGYTTLWASCGEHAGYEGMEAMVSRGFDRVAVTPTADWPAGDRATLKQITAEIGHPADASTHPGGGARDGHQPVFAVVFLMSTHFAYFCPPAAVVHTPIASDAMLLWPWQNPQPLRNRYRNAAGYLDAAVADFIEGVDLSRTVVIITGDHGQSLYGDGVLGHWSRLGDPQTRVPLVILGAGVVPGVVDRPTMHSDVLALLQSEGAIDSPAQAEGDRPMLLVQSRVAESVDEAAVIWRGRRLGLGLHRRSEGSPRVEVRGMLDARGLVNIRGVGIEMKEERARWVRAVMQALRQ